MLSSETEKMDPRVRRTRQLIEQAFTELVKERDFQNLSVQDITERAGINRATFYAHFPDKYALLDHSIQQSFRKEIENRTLNACHFSQENLRTLVITACEFIDEIHERCAFSDRQFLALVEAQVRTQIYDLILHWLEGLPSFDQHSQTRAHAAIAATWALYGLAEEWHRSKRTPPAEQYADQVLPFLAASLGMSVELAEA